MDSQNSIYHMNDVPENRDILEDICVIQKKSPTE